MPLREQSDCAWLRLAFDRSTRHVDADGRLHIAHNNITKAAVNGYAGREIPNADVLGLKPNTIYQLYRDPVELEKATQTANNIQLLKRHIGVSADDPKHMDVVGSTGTDAEWDDPYITNSLVVWDAGSIAGIETESVCQLSSSYRYRADMTPGITPDGIAFDGSMRDITFNHVALVEVGRAGSDVRAGDEQPRTEVTTMVKRKAALALLAAQHKLAADEARKKIATDAAMGVVAATYDKLAMDAAKARDEEDDDGEMAGDEPMEPKAGKAADEREDDDEETEEEKKRREAKDKKARDKAAKDARAAKDKEDQDNKDEEEEDEERRRKTKAEDKKAMDAAISGLKNDLKAARAAERAVRPYIGEVDLAMDSADEIYRFALDHLGVPTKGVHPSAFPAMLSMAPKPGDAPRRLAMDSGPTSTFAKRFPDAPRVRQM